MAITLIPEGTANFPYKEIGIGLVFFKILIETYVNMRQYKRLGTKKDVPEELKGLGIDQKEFDDGKVYSRASMQFSMIQEAISNAIEISIMGFNIFPIIWDYSRKIVTDFGYDANNELYPAVVFILIETLRGAIVSTPFSIYRTFVLEEKFGFNKTTVGQFIKDNVLSLVLKAIFIPLLVCILLYVVELGGQYFYIYVQVAVIIITFIALWFYPNFIAPLFNKFEELQEGELKTALEKLADSVKFPLTKIYVMDASKRTAHSNAYMYGFGKNKRIVLFDSLVNQLDPNEIEAVLCHELGHWKMSHSVKNMLVVFGQIFFLFYVYGFFMTEPGIFKSFGFDNMSIFIGFSLFTFMFTVFSFITEILMLSLIRRFEFQADEFAFNMGRGEQLSNGLKKLFKENKSDVDPDPVYSAFNHSHPTLVERVRFIQTLEKKKE